MLSIFLYQVRAGVGGWLRRGRDVVRWEQGKDVVRDGVRGQGAGSVLKIV